MGIVLKSRVGSPWLAHIGSGGCNGCDIEILSLLTPRYDIERFGIILHGTPRHADVLIVSGPVTLPMKGVLRRVWEQIPDPKFVIACGGCALDGGVYKDCPQILGGVDKEIPVNAYVPGCPPRPEAIAFGAYKLLTSLLG